MTDSDCSWEARIERALAGEPDLEPSRAFARRVLASIDTDARREPRFAPLVFPWRRAVGAATAVLGLGALARLAVDTQATPAAIGAFVLVASVISVAAVMTLLGLLHADLIGD